MNLYESITNNLKESTVSTNELKDALIKVWDEQSPSWSFNEYMDYFRTTYGWDNISREDYDTAWELAASKFDTEENPGITIDGQYFKDKEDAGEWLKSKVAEYGNTYHFPPADKEVLNKLTTKFGNTYFWR